MSEIQVTKTGTWRKGFTFTSNLTDVKITIEPMCNGRTGAIRSYAGWIYNVPGISPEDRLNPLGMGRVYLGHYKPTYRQRLMERIESDLVGVYLGSEVKNLAQIIEEENA